MPEIVGEPPEEWQSRYEGLRGGAVILGEKRTTTQRVVKLSPVHGEDQRTLLGDPDAEDADLPLSATDLSHFRGAKEFQEAARRFTDPEVIGKAYSDALVKAFANADAPMLRILLPYSMGTPPKMEDNTSEENFNSFLSAIVDGKPHKKQTRKRISTIVDGERVDISDEVLE